LPYFVFEINAFQQLKLLETYEQYREAKIKVRELRESQAKRQGSDGTGNVVFSYRMMFAADELQAERLLKEKRQARPMGEHD